MHDFQPRQKTCSVRRCFLSKTSLKKWICAASNLIALIPSRWFVKCWPIFLELNSKGQHQSSGKEKESCCLVFPSSTKREIRQFHVVVVQRRKRNVQRSVMHVQSCCFACLNLLLFCRSRCRRRHGSVNSLFSSKQCVIKQFLDSVFVISGIIKVSVSVISFGLLARLITFYFSSTLIIPNITKTTSNIYLLSTLSSSCPWSSLSGIIIIYNIIGFLNHPLF